MHGAGIPDEPNLAAFVRAAEAYCAAIETHASLAPAVALPRLHGALVRLYAAVLDLPAKETLSDAQEPEASTETPQYALVSNERRDAIGRDLAHWLGDAEQLHDLVDAYALDPELIPVSLAQALVGIHQDLRAGLSTWETQGLAYGVWHWRTFFEAHWNTHIGTALRALEALARRDDGQWPAPSTSQHA